MRIPGFSLKFCPFFSDFISIYQQFWKIQPDFDDFFLHLTSLTLEMGRTRKDPPPLDSTMTARNFGLMAQKELSHVTLETRMSS